VVSLPPTTRGELFYDGAWNNASIRQTSEITITRGLSSESTTSADPMSCECDLDSRDFLYAPRNPESPLFGKVGRNTPFRLRIEAGGPYFTSAGTTGVFSFSTPDNAAFDTTGDLDLRMDCKADDWYSAMTYCVRYTPGTVAFALASNSAGYLYFWWTPASGTRYAKSTVPLSLANGERAVIRVTVDVDNGSSESEVRFWISKDVNAENWTLLGDSVTQATAAPFQNISGSIYVADNQLSLLPDGSSGTDRFRGEVYAFQLWDGVNDQLKVDLEIGRDGVAGGTTLVDGTGFTWTRSGVSSFSNKYYRAVGEVPSWPPTRNLTGSDNYVSIAPTGITRRMDAGNKPVDSALLRFIKDQSPVECWPLTDGPSSTVAKSLVGGQDMQILFDPDNDNGDPQKLAGGSLADWIEPVIAFPPESNGTIAGKVPRVATQTHTDIDFFITGGGSRSDGGFRIIDEGAGTNTDPQIEIFMETYGAGGTVGTLPTTWTYRDDNGSSIGLLFSPNPDANIYNDTNPHHIRLHFEPGSSSTLVELYVDGAFVTNGTLAFGMQPIKTIKYGAGYTTPANPPTMTDRSLGYFTYWESASAPTVTQMYQAMLGFPGETTGERILRLAAENGYTASVSGDNADQATLGLQDRDKLLALLQEASDSDFGYLLERRDALEIYHRGQSTLWNQAPVIELDFSAGLISKPFKPVDDDKLTENDVSVSAKRRSIPSRNILETGSMSVQDPPDGVGRYDNSYEYSYDTDLQAANASYMRLSMGTYDGVRYTRITLNLANERVYAMLHKILRADVGDIIRLTNIPKDHGPGPVDVMIQGYEEVIAPDQWTITFNCRPGAPWTAGQVYLLGEKNPFVWIDTAGCVSGDTADTTQRQIDLYTTADYEWTSDLAHSPYDVRVGGEVMTVLGPQGPILTESLFDTSISPWTSQNGSSVWSDAVVHPHPRARGSLKFTPSGGFSAGGPLSELSAVGTITPSVTYAIGYWVYSVNGLSDFRAVADWYDSAGTYLSTSGATATNAPAKTWTYVSATAAAPANASRYRMRARYGVATTASDVYYIWAPRLTLVSASAIYDTFTRTQADTWGTSDSGDVWGFSGGAAADYDTTGSAGTHTCTAVNSSRYSYIPVGHLDQDVKVTVSTPALATGGPHYVGPVVRFTDFDNNYTCRLVFNTNQTVQIKINKRVAGTQTDITTVNLPWTHSAGGVFAVRMRIDGSRIRAKAWPTSGSTEPTAWHVDVVDTDLPNGSNVGVRTTLDSANTNTLPFVISYWQFETISNQRFSVTRSENNVVKSHVTGEDARLAIPAYVQM